MHIRLERGQHFNLTKLCSIAVADCGEWGVALDVSGLDSLPPSAAPADPSLPRQDIREAAGEAGK